MKRTIEKCLSCENPEVEGISIMASGGFVGEGGALPSPYPTPYHFICGKCGAEWDGDTPLPEDRP